MSDGLRRTSGGAHSRLPAVKSFARWYYRVSPEARGDIEAIGGYLASVGGRGAASAFLARIRRCISLLGRHPYLGRPRGGDLGPGRRSLVCGQHVLIHATDGRTASILRVIDGRRDYPRLFDP